MTAAGRTIVVGANGQVGSSLLVQLGTSGVGISRTEAQLSSRDDLVRALDAVGPVQAVINAAAYTDVDGAETNRSTAMRINGDASQAIAEWSASRNVPIIHFSTDFVFSGSGTLPWSERSETEPVNYYGVTKLRGDVQFMTPGELPNDGKVIEDARKYD